MAVIHNTTMSPSKLELLTAWLPAQPWYLNRGRTPELTKAGGFRLDDPDGEVGIEFMAVTDAVTTYLVPMTYRGSALAGADDALIGTSEHGVLGRRWIYDGVYDPVLVSQLIALLQGVAKPQAQSQSDTPDHTVSTQPVWSSYLAALEFVVTADGPLGTEVRVAAADADGTPAGNVTLRIHRILQPGDGPAHVSATWRLPDDTPVRGPFASAQFVAAP